MAASRIGHRTIVHVVYYADVVVVVHLCNDALGNVTCLMDGEFPIQASHSFQMARNEADVVTDDDDRQPFIEVMQKVCQPTGNVGVDTGSRLIQ